MKAIVSVRDMIVDVKDLGLLDAFLSAVSESRNYDYKNNDYCYYIQPATPQSTSERVDVKLLTNEQHEAERLVWKLKQDEKK